MSDALKLLITFGIFIITLVPYAVLFWLGFYFLDPETFWQKLACVGLSGIPSVLISFVWLPVMLAAFVVTWDLD